ncbi:MAG: hypothetical protein PHH37_06395 [Paludibacter sp.]|nr:hypothetical protein [Paludibacter sp.]
MRARLASLLAALFIVITAQLSAQTTYTVQAVNDDISYSLDLKAVASIFGESSDLEDFERRLNDYDNQISNLDLNGDGEIDYLRVVETSDNNTHLIVIQAVLDVDVYQDVATIVVDRDEYSRTTVRVVGDPYIYGANYIIQPYYYSTPLFVRWFWSHNYTRWYSPYYWGHYPVYYRYRRPVSINIYMTNINTHINYRNRYRHNSYYRNDHVTNLYKSVGRSDYATRHPERTFSSRNSNMTSRRELDRVNNSTGSSSRRSQSSVSRTTSTNVSRSGVSGNESSRRSVIRTNSSAGSSRSTGVSQRSRSGNTVVTRSSTSSGNSRTSNTVSGNSSSRSEKNTGTVKSGSSTRSTTTVSRPASRSESASSRSTVKAGKSTESSSKSSSTNTRSSGSSSKSNTNRDSRR